MSDWVNNDYHWSDLGTPNNHLYNLHPCFLVLKSLLNDKFPIRGVDDKMMWKSNLIEFFNVRDGYELLIADNNAYFQEEGKAEAFLILWRTRVPVKVKMFGWRIFLNKIPFKD